MGLTRTEVVNMINEAVAASLAKIPGGGGGNNRQFLQLKEAREARERQEQRHREQRKQVKLEAKQTKRNLKESRRVFESLGMDTGAAKLAAQGRQFRG